MSSSTHFALPSRGGMAGAVDAYNMPNTDLAQAAAPSRSKQGARDEHDEYQAYRSGQGDLDTRFYHNNAACSKDPSTSIDSILGDRSEYAGTAIPGPHCLAASAADLGWERREAAASAGRDADNYSGPGLDRMLSDPSLGWSDAGFGPAGAGHGGAQPRPNRLASGVSQTLTGLGGAGSTANVLAQSLRSTARGVPTGSAMGSSVSAQQREGAALADKERAAAGGAMPYNVRPGASLR